MKSIQLIILFAFISSLSIGQSYIGVFIGFNSSKLSGDSPNNASYNSLMGLNAGANFDLKLSNSMLLSLQPSYSQEGTKISYSVAGQDEPVDSIKIRLNYFSLPLLLKVATANQRFYALAGLEAGILLNSTVSSQDAEVDITVDTESWNLAMHFGVGLRIPVGFPRLYVEVRYAQGLINLTDNLGSEDYIPRVKTTGFKVLAGIEIPLQKSKN